MSYIDGLAKSMQYNSHIFNDVPTAIIPLKLLTDEQLTGLISEHKTLVKIRQARVLEMRDQGFSHNEISKRLGLAKGSIVKIVNGLHKYHARSRAAKKYKERQVCSVAQCESIGERHHEDYSKPLDIEWLCNLHHKDHHANK